VFVKGARYEKLMEAFGGVGVVAATPAELRSAIEEAIRSKRPTLINAVIDENAGTESGASRASTRSGEEEVLIAQPRNDAIATRNLKRGP
jgi:thiamine pyrophosphate-dependent acetolactate synthase large subunit-like protein